MHITILNFSGKLGRGNCSSITDHIKEKVRQTHEVHSFHVPSLHMIPCGGCQYSCLKPPKRQCDHLDDSAELYKAICDSDAAFYLIPIYSDYPCAHYFIFHEKSQILSEEGFHRYSAIRKHFIFIANTGHENLRHLVESEPGQDNDFLILSTRQFHSRSIDGDLMEIPTCIQVLDDYIDSCLSCYSSPSSTLSAGLLPSDPI